MKLAYTIIAAAVALIYAVIVNFFPTFPLPQDTLMLIVLWLLLQLGVEVVGKPLAERVRSFVQSIK